MVVPRNSSSVRHLFIRRWRPLGALARLTVLAGLLVACAPQAPASPTSAPAPAAPKTEAPAAPKAAAPAGQAAAPAAQASPAAAPAGQAKPAPTRPEAKGSLVIALAEEPPMLASHDGTATFSYPIVRNVDEALLNKDPRTNELVPELATKWEQVNPTTWRFTLRQGVKYHDGTPFNAESAAEELNYMYSKEGNFRVRTFMGPQVTAKAVGEHLLELVTEAPDPILPTRLYFAPFHSTTARKAKPDEYPLKPIGTGPYRFVEWQKGQHVKLEVNPDWWGHTATDAGGAATIKDVTFVFRPEREVRTAMVTRGEADLGRWLSQEQCKTAAQCKGGPTVETVFVRIDTMNPVFADKRIREAIAYAIDKDGIMNGLLGGGEIAPMMVTPQVTGFNPALKPYPYDPNRAKQLVAEAKAAGVPVDTTPLKILARRGAYFRVEEGTEAIGEMLKQVGFSTLKVEVLEVAKHTEIYNAPKPIDPSRGLLAFHSHGNELGDFGQTARFYYMCDGRQSTYCNPEVDKRVTEALSLAGDARVKAYHDLAKFVHDEVVTVPVGYPNFYFGMSKRVDWTPRRDGFILVKEMKLTE